MAELNLKQISDKLNTEFTGEVRKLVFWYDADAEFVEDVDTLDLSNAKVLHLEPDNQFYIKYFLECVDTETSYLIYAPFAKPGIRENHLADTLKYSTEFTADRASLIVLDLGLDERFKPVIQRHIKFFGEKKRTQAFYDLGLNITHKSTLEIAMMSVLCKCKIPSYEEVLRRVLMDRRSLSSQTDEEMSSAFESNSCLDEFAKYSLLDAFWEQAADLFGYVDEQPTLEKLMLTMFVTYASKTLSVEVPTAWVPFISFKSGSIIAFLDQLMNSCIYGERFDELSEVIYARLNGEEELSKLPVESLVSCGIFSGIDEILIRWVVERLELEDVAAKLEDRTIPQLLKKRRQEHFGTHYRNEYFLLENAWYIISNMQYVSAKDLNDLVKHYTSFLYQMDQHYRYFYYYLDKINTGESKRREYSFHRWEAGTLFESLKERIENIYANDYLSKVCINWTDLFCRQKDSLNIIKQYEFYNKNVSPVKDQLVVILSDALRYEVGVSLFEKLQEDEKCTAEIKTMISTLPSVTSYGMAALLPHKTLELTEDYSVLVDGMKANTTEQRQAVLQKYNQASRCVQYDEIKNMSVADLRSIFTRQQVVYIYHNQVDARGDNASTENEVFLACEEAVDEIRALIRRLTTSANRSHFIVTSDHGFLYRREKLAESDKVRLSKENRDNEADYTTVSDTINVSSRRYLLSENGVISEGVASLELGSVMGNQDKRKVTYPVGPDVFKTSGAGLNYVHGGCSPQEMLIPLVEVKTEKGFKETTTAQIDLVSLTSKITNLITSMDFVQTEAVSDVVKETTYRIYFVDGNGEKISNEHLYIADKKEKETMKRVFRLRFSFKNKKYDKFQKYYLVAIDDHNSLEVLRHEVVMDISPTF